jgi:acetolactate synthase I/II/III large subunit
MPATAATPTSATPRTCAQIYPDFVAVCRGASTSRRAGHVQARPARRPQRMLDADEPYVLDVITPYTEHVLPFIPAGKSVAEMIYQSAVLQGGGWDPVNAHRS